MLQVEPELEAASTESRSAQFIPYPDTRPSPYHPCPLLLDLSERCACDDSVTLLSFPTVAELRCRGGPSNFVV
jgi:hypothetical protein